MMFKRFSRSGFPPVQYFIGDPDKFIDRFKCVFEFAGIYFFFYKSKKLFKIRIEKML